MSTKRLPYVDSNIDRYGNVRYYFRRHKRRTRLPDDPTSAEFQQAYADALKASTGPPKEQTKRFSDRSLAALIREYEKSPSYRSLAPSARRQYDVLQRHIEDAWGSGRVDRLTRATVNRLMANRADEPKKANRMHKRLRALMEYAIDLGWISINPVGKRAPYRPGVKAFRAWPEDQIKRFQSYWKRGTPQRVAFDLLLYLGQRSGDTVAMRADDIRDGRIRVVQSKTSSGVEIRLHADLRATLDAGPVGKAFLIETQSGRPRAVKGFYNWLKAAIRDAGCDDDLSPHGLRKSAATRLADIGASAAQICAVTGHKSVRIMEQYIQSRDQIRLADSAIRLLEEDE